MQILMAGGNAIDAAVAVAATLNVVEPQSSGIGGNGFMVLFDKETSTVHSLNMTGAAPKALQAAEMDAEALAGGIRAGVVPGNLGGLVEALRRFGSKSLAEVLAPAIGYAEDGHPINASLSGTIERMRPRLEQIPSSARVFLPGGRVPREGEMFKAPDLARTLQKLVEAEKVALAAGRGPTRCRRPQTGFTAATSPTSSAASTPTMGAYSRQRTSRNSRQRGPNRSTRSIAGTTSTATPRPRAAGSRS